MDFCRATRRIGLRQIQGGGSMRIRRSVLDYIAHLRVGRSVAKIATAYCVTPGAIYSAMRRAGVSVSDFRHAVLWDDRNRL